MTCRSQLLVCAMHMREETGQEEFTVAQLTRRMKAEGAPYSPVTIRTYIMSRMCTNATRPQFPKYDDFKHVGRGHYKFIFKGSLVVKALADAVAGGTPAIATGGK